ncbi:hypothetical protein [Candidatus Odyssella thessalonicensis]|nr:hypothetical protein [Candidatus Odyssella thessalonicensis]
MRAGSTFALCFLVFALTALANCNSSPPGADRPPRDAFSHRYDSDTYNV